MGLIFLIIWAFLFITQKRDRKEMLTMSIIFAIIAPIAEYLFIQDWWKPLTISNTAIGIETIIVGFMIGGIASISYSVLFQKKLKKISRKTERELNLNLILFLSILAILSIGLFYLLNNSLIATIIAFSVPTILMLIKRKDLIWNSIVSGIILLVIAFVVYFILNLLTPGWVNQFWYFKNVPSTIILSLPIDDILWYFFAGAFIGPLYEYWEERKLISIKKKKN